MANKFQTGFDQPLLHTMYVDKKLGGVNAVQTLSRLNRTHPEKQSTMVLDFANETDEIRASFEPYYETTILSEATDPNLLYEKQGRIEGFPVFTETDVEDFAAIHFGANSTQDRLYATLSTSVERFKEMHEDERRDFRGEISDYVRLYSFLAQILPFSDVGLEKLYAFAPSSTSAAAPRRGGVASGNSAEHRYGVLSYPGDWKRKGRTGSEG